MKRWSCFIALGLLWSCGDEAQPARASYCLEVNEVEGANARMAAYWSGAELAVDQPLVAPYCLSVPEPKNHDALRAIDPIKVLLSTGRGATVVPHLETYAPLLIIYEDEDGDQRFTPPGPDGVVSDSVLKLSYGEDEEGGLLSWLSNYTVALQSLRNGYTQLLFATQPEPGIPFVYSRDDFYYDDEFLIEKRAEPFEALPLPLIDVDPWCQVEAKLLSCGPLVKGDVEQLWEEQAPEEIWHAPTLSETIRDEAYLDEDYPAIDRFMPDSTSRIWEEGQYQSCWLVEGVAITVQEKYYDAELDPCACEVSSRGIKMAAPADDLPPWWPCTHEPDPDEDTAWHREYARDIAEEIGLHLPTPSAEEG